MTHRLSFAEFKTRATTAFADPSIKVGTSLDADYMTTFGQVFPAVWITAQKIMPAGRDDGRGVTGMMRQNLRVGIVVRCLVARISPDGNPYDPETALAALEAKARDAFFGWTPTNARMPLAWEQIIDGPPYESCVSSDLYFTTEVADARSPLP